MGTEEAADLLRAATVWILPALLAITLHEAGHAFAATLLGDNTPRAQGRVSLNPARHIDPIGTIAIPLTLLLTGAPFLFGWARPVIVDFRNLRNQRWGSVLVALAGPGMNIVLALVAGLAWHGFYLLPDNDMGQFVARNVYNLLLINVSLAVFNLIPLLPLDGGRILLGLLPRPLAIQFAQTERYGMMVLMLLIVVLPLIHSPVSLSDVLYPVMQWLKIHVLLWTGNVLTD